LTGLDKIISEILEESEKEAQDIIAAATARADEILAEARQAGEALSDRLNAQSAKKLSALISGQESAIAMQHRREKLAARQRLIAETLHMAQAALCALPDAQYFDLLIGLAAKAAHAGDGLFYVNTRDAGRLPADFEARLGTALPQGASLKAGSRAIDIDGGLVLEYGSVVENCAISAIFSARSDAFSDIVRDILMH